MSGHNAIQTDGSEHWQPKHQVSPSNGDVESGQISQPGTWNVKTAQLAEYDTIKAALGSINSEKI